MKAKIDCIVVGSRALYEFSIPFRKFKDIDVLICKDDTNSKYACKSIMRYDVIEISEDIFNNIPCLVIDGVKYATPDAVYTLKCSHLGWDIKFDKHKNDVLYLKHIGCSLLEDLYYKLTSYWKETNGNLPHLDFYKTKNDFFDDAVLKIYDHDYLHELVAYPNLPIYKTCLAEGFEVLIDQAKFLSLSEENKILFFKEEMTVIAVERWLIPPDWKTKYNIQTAWELAVHKTIVSLTKDWMTDFIIFNIEKFVKPDLKLFKNLIEKEIIMPKQVLTDKESKKLLEELSEAFALQYDPKENLENFMNSILFYDNLPSEDSNYEFKLIEQKGGEDQGTYAYSVIFWKNKLLANESDGNYYKFEYSYSSYNGYDFSCMNISKVKPRQQTITIYD